MGRHIAQLLSLHADKLAGLGHVDLSSMDDAAKRVLLRRINTILGIEPISPPV